MIKNNELPDIFNKKKKKKHKKIDYYVHIETTNPTFLKMHVLLKNLGIKNNTFFLALHDTSLIGVNPYDKDLTIEQKARILKECSINFWYFIREVVRIPVSGSDVGQGKRYELHRGNLALNFCVVNNLNSYTELPRQVGKSIAVDIYILWLYNFATTNSQIMMTNKDHKNAKDNLTRVRNIRDVLPEFLQFKYRYNSKGERLKNNDPAEEAKNPKNNNHIVTYGQATSEEKADAMGRGATQPVQWYDEFGFIRYNLIIYEAASPAASQASDEAKANGKPYAKIITSTPGDMKKDTGKNAYKFLKQCAIFNEELYDWKMDDVKEYIDKSDNGFVYVKFSYKQIGRSQAYFDKQCKELAGNIAKIKREVLLEWNDKVENSPFDEDDIEELENLKKIHIRKVFVNKFYVLYLYEQIDPRYKTIISVDVATGNKKDHSVIVLINTRTKSIVGILESNQADTVNFASIIYTIAKTIVPNSLICIENNGVGNGPITNLLHTDIKHKLYFTTNKTNSLKDKVRDGSVVETDVNSRSYGVNTSGSAREFMFEKLCLFVKYYKKRILPDIFIEQLKNLQYGKNGRIDHGPGLHDDIIMAYLIGIYAYYYGDMQKFGIMRFPDYDEDDMVNEEQLLDQHEKELRSSKQHVMSALLQSTADINYSEYVETDLPDELKQGTTFKTIRDYYDEMDEQVARARNGQSITTHNNSGEFFDMLNSSTMGGSSSYEEQVEQVFSDYY